MFLSEWREFPSAHCIAGKKKLDDRSRLDFVEIAHVPNMLPSLFTSWSGYTSTPTYIYIYIYIYISHTQADPLSMGNTFQDLPRLRETADNTERKIT